MRARLHTLLLDYLLKSFADVFLVVGLGIPTSLLITREGDRYLQRVMLASVVLSGLYLYLIFMVGTTFALMGTSVFRITVAAVFLAPFLFERTRHHIALLARPRPLTRIRIGRFEVIGFTIIIFFLSITLIQSLASTPILDDPLAVWLFLGKQIYLSGRIPVYYGNAADISWSGNYPPIPSFIAAATFLFLNRVDAFDYGLIPWLYGAVGLLAAYVLVRELNGSRRAAVFAVLVAIFTTIYSMQMMGWGYVDTVVTFYVTAFLAFTFMKSVSSEQNGLFAALSFALAMLSKYDALLLLIPSILLLFLLRRSLFRSSITLSWNTRTLPWLAAFTILGVSWYIRNWAVVGDPVYPFLYNIFPARGINPGIISLVPIYREPLSIIWSDATFTGLTNEGNLWPLITFGGAGLFSLLVTAMSKRRLLAFSLWTLASLCSLLGFTVLHGGFERYVIVLVPAVSVCSGFLIDHIALARTRHFACNTTLVNVLSKAAGPTLLLALILISPSSAYFFQPPHQPSADFLSWWKQVNRLPPGIVATNDLRLFYLDHPVVQLYNMPSLFTANSTYRVWQALKNTNVSYVYFNARFDQDVFRAHTFLLQTLGNSSYMTLLFANDSRYPSYGEGTYLVK